MKIKTLERSWDEVKALPPIAHQNPHKPSRLLSFVARTVGASDLKETHFTCEMDLGDAEHKPALILMNHSSFIDLEMMMSMFAKKPFNIVCTSDGFVGKYGLMHSLGCIPTQKFVSDINLIRDIKYCLQTLKTSVLMYPEASYTFDGCETPLPEGLGVLVRMLKAPVIMVRTHGAFLRDPLYNNLQKRQVDVSAKAYCLITEEEAKTLSTDELTARIKDAFTFNNFEEQKEEGIKVTEPFRADGLHRILFRCCDCGAEGQMEGLGTSITCHHCGHSWVLEENGELKAQNGDARFSMIPDWFKWERAEIKKEIENHTYLLDTKVKIGVMADYKAIYWVGDGQLRHDEKGFSLVGCDGELTYSQSALSNYSVYSDYYWYEIGDVICIGNAERLYYCFPEKKDIVAKTRLAAEELYKLAKARKGSRKEVQA